jgi:hypothetical protein
VLAGTGLMKNGRTLSLSVPVSASDGDAGAVNGMLTAMARVSTREGP